jgi:hypothetical protein
VLHLRLLAFRAELSEIAGFKSARLVGAAQRYNLERIIGILGLRRRYGWNPRIVSANKHAPTKHLPTTADLQTYPATSIVAPAAL